MRDDRLSHRASVIVGEACDVDMVHITGPAHGDVRWDMKRGRWVIRIDPIKATDCAYTMLHECGHVCTETVAGPEHLRTGKFYPGHSSPPEHHHKTEAAACRWVVENAHKHASGDAMAIVRRAAANFSLHASQLMAAKAATMRQQVADLEQRLTQLERQFQPTPKRRVRTW